jgi:Zn-dependent protease
VGGETGQVLIFVVSAGVAGIVINVVLLVLNLLPVPPLDGGRVLTGVVPLSVSRWLDRIEPFGMLIVLALLISGALSTLMGPVIRAVILFILGLVHMSPELFQAVHAMIQPSWGG